MNTVLWVAQVLLAVVFMLAGGAKVVMPFDRLEKVMGWVKHSSRFAVRGLGTLEVLGAIGVIVPALTGILPWLTPLAAVGMVCIMIGALYVHFQEHEMAQAVVPIVTLLLALFVAYGRFVAVPL